MSEIAKEIINIMKNSVDEKTLMESNLEFCNHPKKLKSIGYVKDMESEYKNEYFDEVYEDEYGIIIDLRFCEKQPSDDEMKNFAEYWDELTKKYNRLVEPVFMITGKK